MIIKKLMKKIKSLLKRNDFTEKEKRKLEKKEEPKPTIVELSGEPPHTALGRNGAVFELHDRVINILLDDPGGDQPYTVIYVHDGVAELYGVIDSEGIKHLNLEDINILEHSEGRPLH